MANKVCKIESEKIVNGNGLFNGNYSLQKWDSDLSSLENGAAMFYWCTALETFSCDNLNKLVNGEQMFGHTKIQSFTYDMINLENGAGMFYQCPNLTNFKSNLNSLKKAYSMFDSCTLTDESIHNIASGLNRFPTDGTYNDFNIGTRSVPIFDATMNDIGIMYEKGWNPVCGGIYADGISYTPWEEQTFYGCSNVSEVTNAVPNYKTECIIDGVWNEHLSDLTHGGDLFQWAADGNGYGFTAFNADLSRLENGSRMFSSCYDLTAFDSNLNSLTKAEHMFYCCQKLSNFNVKLPSLTYGNSMFHMCINLTTFNSDLSNLTNGYNMFYNCKLDTASVQNIADTIKDVKSLTNGTATTDAIYKQIAIRIGNSTPNEQEIAAFNKMTSKGWTVYVTGSSGSSSQWNPTSLDGEEISTPIPFYAKPVPATEETASYIDSDGNYYNILGAQFIYGADLSTYGMFVSEEDAAANMRLTKIEK